MTQSKSKKSKVTAEDPDSSGTRSDGDALPEIQLISFEESEPEPQADLGDFTEVWRYLASQPDLQRDPKREDDNLGPLTSHTQLQKKEITFDDHVTVNYSSGKYGKDDISQDLRLSDETTSSKPKKIRRKRGKNENKTIDSSAEDEGEESSWDPSSFEENRSALSFHRRKSFLYVPPSFTTPNAPPNPPNILPAAPGAADRRRKLIQLLIQKYPYDEHTILSPSKTPTYLSTMSSSPLNDLHVFVDNSNILIGFYERYKIKHDVTDPFFRAPKFDFHAFATILERGRPVSRKFLVGSNPLVQPVPLAQHLGYEVSILERVVDTKRTLVTASPYASDSATRTPQREKKKEQAVDEILHLKILECLLDVTKPGIMVLATGDAAPAEFSPDGGFLKCIQRALKRGWDVELVCWRKSMSRLWREKTFLAESKNKFKVIELDDFVDELVLE